MEENILHNKFFHNEFFCNKLLYQFSQNYEFLYQYLQDKSLQEIMYQLKKYIDREPNYFITIPALEPIDKYLINRLKQTNELMNFNINSFPTVRNYLPLTNSYWYKYFYAQKVLKSL